MRRLDFVRLSSAGLAGALLAPGSACSAAQAAQTPLVPFRMYSYHWDDHYFAWLPAHPRFESIELMTVSRGPLAPPLRWAFFTERAAPKRQQHYYDDAAIAKASGGIYAPISVALGPANAAGLASAAIGFSDATDEELRWTLSFAPEAAFSPAGLTDQSGHDAVDMTLFFYREKVAYAQFASVTIGDVSYPPSLSPAGSGSSPPAAYSRNVFTAIVPYGPYAGTFDGGAIALDDGRRLALLPAGSAAADGDALLLSPQGTAPVGYRIAAYGHTTELAFDAPLRAGRCAFSLAFDDATSVLSGTARTLENGAVTTVAFEPLVPAWSRSYAFTTRFERTADGFLATTRRGLA
ncbi:MAG: hypothetical protein ACLPYS_07345 [Vulcanimicrobiaceae bacterium]